MNEQEKDFIRFCVMYYLNDLFKGTNTEQHDFNMSYNEVEELLNTLKGE